MWKLLVAKGISNHVEKEDTVEIFITETNLNYSIYIFLGNIPIRRIL